MHDELSRLKTWWAGLNRDVAYCAGNHEFATDVLALMQRCEKAECDLLDARAEHRECQEALARETGRRLTAEQRIKELEDELKSWQDRAYKIQETINKRTDRVKELEGALREIVALKWGAFGCSEPAHIAERLLNGGGEDE